MPYTTCPRCGLLQYSAAAWSTQDRCPGCDGFLRSRRDWALEAPFHSAVRRDLRANATAPGLARQALEGLRAKMDAVTLNTSRLLVSELVANGVEHGPNGNSFIQLRASVGLGSASCEPQAEGLEHWGLFLVDDLAHRWGAESSPEATSVWFEIDGPWSRADADFSTPALVQPARPV